MKILRTNDIVEITFDDPSSKNSFSVENAAKWAYEVTSSETRLMILRSEGSVFCSGGNLSDYAAMKSKEEGVHANAEIRKHLEVISKVPCLKVAFVTGDCFGGGVEVLSVCDHVYSLRHVFFGLWQSRMHLSFGWGGFERLVRRMKTAAIQLWLAEGRTHSAYWAHEQGLVDELLTESALSEKLLKLKSSNSHYFGKELQNNEAQFFDSLWWSEEHRRKLLKFKS